MTTPLLEVRDLAVTAAGPRGPAALLRDVTFAIASGESVGLVGASGAGKSTLGAALLRLLPRGVILEPRSVVRFEGADLLSLGEEAMRQRRGRRIASVFQEPLQALDPSMRIGDQLVEALTVHEIATADEARDRAIAMLARVGIADAPAAAERYPHEFSGGMRQRILIAAALLPSPSLLVADEPTTALDTTIQAQVLDLLDELRAETGVALLLISHDVEVVGERCERLLVLDAGRLVEDGATASVLAAPRSPSGARIVAARRRRRPLTATTPSASSASPSTSASALGHAPLLSVESLTVRHPDRRRRGASGGLVAVDDVAFTIAPGEAVGVVGESGCGKTSLAHAVLRLIPASGRVALGETDLLACDGEPLRRLRRRLQLVPQDAGASLTPHFTVGSIVAEGLEVHGIAGGADAAKRAAALLHDVGLGAEFLGRRPHELSAGERQRVAIARALSTGPDLLVCDEPIASVDAPTREMLLDLLDGLRRERGLALLFISHDLVSVARLASRVLVMYLGRVVETGPTATVLGTPRMPYTQALLAAVPTGDPAARRRRITIGGESGDTTPTGCALHPRCPHPLKDERCTREPPVLAAVPGTVEGHRAACWKRDRPMDP